MRALVALCPVKGPAQTDPTKALGLQNYRVALRDWLPPGLSLSVTHTLNGAGRPKADRVSGQVVGHNAASADDHTVTDGNTGKNAAVHTNPDIVTDAYVLRAWGLMPHRRVEIVIPVIN